MEGKLRQLDGATNVLLKEPPMGQDRGVCTKLIERSSPAGVLFVTYTKRPDACVEKLDDPNAFDHVGVVTVGEGGATSDRSGVVTETISTPSDLTGLGIQIGQFLSEWRGPVHVCFDSITSLLQYVEFRTAYEFLHAITGQVHAADASSHFHVDPAAHDAKEVAGITSLFDASVSLEDDLEVRARDILDPSD